MPSQRSLLTDEEDRGDLVNLGDIATPSRELSRTKYRTFGANPRCDAELEIWRAVANELLDKLHIAVGRLDKDLRLALGTHTMLQLLECLHAASIFADAA